jgi:hypothetical protein
MAMSWDLVVFDFEAAYSDPKTRTAIFPDKWEPPAIAAGKIVRAKISEALPKVNWVDPTWGTVDDHDFSLEFNMGGEEVISNFMIHARGHATPAVLALMSATGWRILDTTTGKWMHETANPDEGREAFQGYLDTVLEGQATAKKPNLLKRIFGW